MYTQVSQCVIRLPTHLHRVITLLELGCSDCVLVCIAIHFCKSGMLGTEKQNKTKQSIRNNCEVIIAAVNFINIVVKTNFV